jgi:hypothetical protein
MQLLFGLSRIPMRTLVLLGVIWAVNLLWITAGVSTAWDYHGHTYTAGIVVINVTIPLALAGLWIAARKRPSFLRSLAFHWLAWVWLTLYAFPYLGVLP